MAIVNNEKLLDSALAFASAQTFSAADWGQVGGSDAIVDLGSSGLHYFDLVLKVTACTANSVAVRLMGSNTDPGADAEAHTDWHLLATVELGDTPTGYNADEARQLGIYSASVDNQAVLNATDLDLRDYAGMRWLAVHVGGTFGSGSVTMSIDGALRRTI